jgi:hypothetical protein
VPIVDDNRLIRSTVPGSLADRNTGRCGVPERMMLYQNERLLRSLSGVRFIIVGIFVCGI